MRVVTPTSRAGALRGAAALLLLTGLLAGCGGREEPKRRTLRVEMRYSRFLPETFSVKAGTTVRFVLVNADPIAHEFILGDEAVQQTHERRRDRIHDSPGEASLAAGETKAIEFTFSRPGILIFGCHRPGHYRYGMRGVARVEG